MKYVARTPLAGMVRSGCQGKRRVRRDTVPAILIENCGVPMCAKIPHNHPFCSARRAASIRFCAPSFCMAVER